MSRYTNIVTGEKYMTEINALRHYISKGKKALKANNYESMYNVWSKASKIIDAQLCYKCIHDDIGYCGLRRNNINEKEKFIRFCFPSVLRYWEEELKRRL